MRTGRSPRWQGIGLVNNPSVKKKNLGGKEAYHFRVKPLGIGPSSSCIYVCIWWHTWLDGLTMDASSLYLYMYMYTDIVDDEWAWSPGSEGLSPLTLAPHIRTLLGSELVGKDGAKVPVEALAGKVVGA